MSPMLSLRQRLFGLILLPLILMALLLGYWRYTVALETATELFDRSLLATALAVSRDVAISGGDALLPSTLDLIRDATGGEVFYHATGPGGIYVTGYAYPPAGGGRTADPYRPTIYEATYRGEPVRVLRLTERQTIENLTGDSTVTVWQRLSDRTGFARELAVRAAALLGALLITLAVVVWFGVQRGLRPLTDLQDAIAMRSPDDLSTIRRAVPEETRGIVETLNRLLQQVNASITAHQSFISNAAHQLRNPAAAVRSMAESVRDAGSEEERLQRTDELVKAAHASARVTEQLLSLDRLRHDTSGGDIELFDLNSAAEDACAEVAPPILAAGIGFSWQPSQEALPVLADKLFVVEAIKNLIDNAHKHGGSDLSQISVSSAQDAHTAAVTVHDDGIGLVPEQTDMAFGRFSQVEPSSGSGLGLAIAASVAARHNGTLKIDAVETGASLTLSMPLQATKQA